MSLRTRIPDASDRLLNVGSGLLSREYRRRRNTVVDAGTVMNRIREVVPSPIKEHCLSDGSATAGGSNGWGSLQWPVKRRTSIFGLSWRTSNT